MRQQTELTSPTAMCCRRQVVPQMLASSLTARLHHQQNLSARTSLQPAMRSWLPMRRAAMM